MIARPPPVKCPSCPAEAGQWCHDEEYRICTTTRAMRSAATRGRDAIAEAARLRAAAKRERTAALRGAIAARGGRL